MARCGCGSSSTSCNCSVKAGANVTVTGSGAAGNPYVVSSTAAGSTVAPLDTETVDMTVTGGPAYVVSADVVISPNAGNTLIADGSGLFVPAAVDQTTVSDTNTVDLTKTGFDITADVIVSPDAGNQLVANANGLFVPPDVDPTFTAGNGIDAAALATNLVQACLSTDAGNEIVFGTDGCLFVPTPAAATPVTVTDTTTVDLTLTGQDISADVILSPDAGNTLVTHANGLYVPAGTVVTVAPLDTTTVDTTVSGGPSNYIVSSDVIISPDAGNQLVANANGLFVPPDVDAPITVTPLDTATFDSVVTGTDPNFVVSGNVKISAAAGNQVVANADGLFVPADVDTPVTVTDSPTVDLTLTGQDIQADVIISPDAGNTLVAHANGLYVADVEVPVTVTALDTATFDSVVTGTDPNFVVSGNVKISTAAGNTLTSDATGLYVADIDTVITNGAGIAPVVGGVVAACLSTDAGNALSFGTDNCLFAPAASAGVTVTDTPTVDLTLTGSNIKGDVKISAAAGNQVVANADGLFVPADIDVVPTVAALDTATVNTTVTGGPNYVVSSDVIVSPDAGNTLVAHANGLYVADVDTPVTVTDTTSVNLTLVGQDIQADVIISPDANNKLSLHANGLYATECVSTDAGNIATIGTDGCVFVPAGGVTVTDTNSVDLTLTGSNISAAVILDPAATNLLSVSAAGVLAQVHSGPCGISGAGTVASPLVAITATAADWASKFACAQVAANGTGIYCDTATGQLIGTPPTTRVVTDQTLTSVAGSAEVNAIGVPIGGAPAVFGPTLTGTFTNTNTCRAMIVTVTGGVKHFNMRADTGGRLQFQYGLQLTLTGPAAGTYSPNGSHVQFMADGNRTGTDPNWDFIWDTVATTQIQQFVLPAGASFNYTLQGIAQLTNYNGDGQVNTLQVFAHFDGQTI